MKRSQFLGFFFCVCLCFDLMAESQVRAAIDIGMGGPKLQVAEVDVTANKIVKMVHTQRYYVNFYEAIAQSGSNELTPEIREEGIRSIKEAVDQAHALGAEKVVAIATASLRAAGNGEAFANEIWNETGIQVHIIEQDLEGKLAFQAALSKLDIAAEHLVVWDIGGGSVQFIAAAAEGAHLVKGREDGVGTFKDVIIENIQQRNRKEATSPNPMSKEDIDQALNHAQSLARETDKSIKDKLNQPTTTIVGVGSVFAYGIHGMLGGKNLFSVEDLAEVVGNLPGKTDADLGGGDYAHVEGSNTVFVLGFMHALKIEKMRLLNVNNADGAMLYEPFWK